MQKHTKKMIAPIVIAAIMIAYYLAFIAICIFVPLAWWIKLLCGIGPLSLIGVCVYVLRERIIEIRKGEEDDLGKY